MKNKYSTKEYKNSFYNPDSRRSSASEFVKVSGQEESYKGFLLHDGYMVINNTIIGQCVTNNGAKIRLDMGFDNIETMHGRVREAIVELTK